MKLFQGRFLAGILLLGALMVGAPLALAKQISQQGDNNTVMDTSIKDEDEIMVSASGKISTKTINDESYFVLLDAGGKTLYYLEAGPPWYYTNNNKAYPLEEFVNQQVTITGEVEQPRTSLPENANARAKANKAKAKLEPTDAPSLEVFTINGQTVRSPGRPPWAGGPKKVPGHPGKGNQWKSSGM